MFKSFYLFVLLFIFFNANANQKKNYWVVFKDKTETFSSFSQYTNIPVNQNYINELKPFTDSITFVSKWLNAAACRLSHKSLHKLHTLPFIKEIIPIESDLKPTNFSYHTQQFEVNETLILKGQLASLQANEFQKLNINGKGIRIAVFDAGFKSLYAHPAFKHLRDNGKIIKTWDFIKNREKVDVVSFHGTNVLSCIAGIIGNDTLGLAPEAEFLLARTERTLTEPLSEEENWVAALEWAFENGAQIINSSLGYSRKRYTKNDMNGHTSMVSKAANIAAAKGMLIINAAGNEGDSKWRIIAAPADADSVLTVGGINPNTGIRESFSSIGPTSDFRMKPNVCAFGRASVATSAQLGIHLGTSYSAPLITGFAACVWQLNPQYNNIKVFKEIEKSGKLYPYFDYSHGFGIPQASYFTSHSNSPLTSTFNFSRVEGKIIVKIINFAPSELNENEYFYYHIADSLDRLEEYHVLKRTDFKEIVIPVENKSGKKLRMYYKNYKNEIVL